MRRARGPALLFIALAACGGGAGRDGAGGATAGASSGSSASRGTGGAASAASGAARPLDRADCERLLDHYLELQVAEVRAAGRPDEVPSDEELAKIRALMRDSDMDGCLGAARAPFDCAMATASKPAMRACLEPASPAPPAPRAAGESP